MYIYHSQEIKTVVPITEVLAMYGMPNDPRRMIPCPDIKHMDTHPSAKIYPQSNTCHCFACGANVNPIDLVMQQENVTFPQACEILIERFGLDKDIYAEKVSSGNEESVERKDLFPLSPKEMKLLGLAMIIDIKEPYMDMEGRMQIKHTPYSMSAFWKEDPEAFSYIVSGKISEMLERKLDESEKSLDYVSGFPYELDEKFEENDELCAHAQKLYETYVETGAKPPRFSKDLDILFAYTSYKTALDDYYKTEADLKTLEDLSLRFPVKDFSKEAEKDDIIDQER